RLRLFQIARVEPFSEPAVDRSKQLAGLSPLALITPQTGEAGRGTQLKDFRALLFGDRVRLMVTLLSAGSIAPGQKQEASQPVQLGLAVPLVGGLDQLRSLV